MTKTKNNYVDNKKFYQCIVEYKQKVYEAEKNGTSKPRIPEYAGLCIMLIAENVAKHRSFNRYSYKDEMILDGIQNCIKYFDRFDETKYKNPHTYFTMICFNANKQRIKDERKNRYGIYKKFEQDYILSSNREFMVDGKNNLINEPIYDNINEYITDYEDKEKLKKEKRAEKLKEKSASENLERFFENE